jgi:hypothetical protein
MKLSPGALLILHLSQGILRLTKGRKILAIILALRLLHLHRGSPSFSFQSSFQFQMIGGNVPTGQKQLTVSLQKEPVIEPRYSIFPPAVPEASLRRWRLIRVAGQSHQSTYQKRHD